MKACLILGVCAVVAVGFIVAQSEAAIELTIKVELAPGYSGVINPGGSSLGDDGNVWYRVYAYFAGMNGSYADDGIATFQGSIRSSNGGLQGDLSFALREPNFTQGTGTQQGTVQNLDGDTDLDIGSNTATAQAGYIYGGTGSVAMHTESDSNHILVGSGYFHTPTTWTMEANTMIAWSFRPKSNAPGVQQYKLDGNNKFWRGTETMLGADPGVNIIFIPEPMTLALLAAGGTALLAFRRRRKAA